MVTVPLSVVVAVLLSVKVFVQSLVVVEPKLKALQSVVASLLAQSKGEYPFVKLMTELPLLHNQGSTEMNENG